MAATRVDLDSRYLAAQKEDGVLTVTIDRPERRNALTIEMYHGLKKAAVLTERDPEVDFLVVTGRGDYFCVGGEMGGQHEGGARIDRETDALDLLPFVQFERCPKTIVVAINGMCQGGGLNLTLTSDVAIASDRATFRAPELLRGVRDSYLGARLVTRIGVARAKWLLFAAQPLSAADALAMGLISRIVPHAEFAERLRETIDWLRQTAPGARAALKRDINRHLPPIDDAMFAEGLASEECREGFRAFVEKRPPAWVRKPGPTG